MISIGCDSAFSKMIDGDFNEPPLDVTFMIRKFRP